MDIQNYLANKGVDCIESGSQLLTTCFYCKKEGHFYINPTNGLWKCHRCGEAGTFKRIQKLFGDTDDIQMLSAFTGPAITQDTSLNVTMEQYQKSIDALSFDATQMPWLQKERGLSISTIGHFKLGVKRNSFSKENNANIDWIAIPHIQNNAIVNIKYRSGAGTKKDFRHIKGCPMPLFNRDGVTKGEPLIICEGEFDAMILWQYGFTNVVTGGGCGTFKPEWFDFVQSIGSPVVFVVFDTDVPGQTGAKELCKRLGDDAKNIILPVGKDISEYFVAHKKTKADFQSLLDKALIGDLESVITVNTALDMLAQQEEAERLSASSRLKTPWDTVNTLISGKFETGELIVLSARAKVGKTTFALNIAYELAKCHNIPVLFMCLEMRPERLVKKLCSLSMGINDLDLTKSDFENARSIFNDVPFYFSYFWDDIGMDKIEKVFTLARRRFGIKLAVFDNLHFLPRSSTNVVAEIGIVSKRFKKLAENLGIPIILIAQPRRVDKNDVVSSEDLKDSSAIKADADKVILVHRESMMAPPPEVGAAGIEDLLSPTDTALHPLTMIKVDASRYSAGGSTFLWFDGALSRYRKATIDEVQEFKNLYGKKRRSAKQERF